MGQEELSVGQGLKAANASWNFSGPTAENFNEHVQKSVPFYNEGHDLVCQLSDFFVHDNSICYELGSSQGTLTKKLSQRHQNKPHTKWIGIDNVLDMTEKAKQDLDPTIKNIQFLCEDINNFPYEKSDFIVAYYTMQFIPPYLRQELINKIYETLNWGGAFILFEKVRANDARFQDYMTTLYTDYKLHQGYRADEIVAKARSLKRVLEPFSSQGNVDLLKRAGFVDTMTVMKYVCFEGILAIK